MLSIEALRRGVLWTFLAVSAFAAIEPSPYEFMFAIALLAFASRRPEVRQSDRAAHSDPRGLECREVC